MPTPHYHPLASYCWKALIALYETGAPFTPKLVNLGDAVDAARFKALWPIGKFPVLEDGGAAIPESTIIIEHLNERTPGLIPADATRAREARLWDRIFDLYVHNHMQAIVADRLRPAESRDPLGVAEARESLDAGLAVVNDRMADRRWALGDDFTIADCAAAPALYYANKVAPYAEQYPNVSAYVARLAERPSFARVLKEAEPYFVMFPADA